MKKFTRIEARVVAERNGLANVITELVVGMTLTDDSGLSVAYRDTLVSLPDADEASFIAFEDIDEAWCLVICEKAAEDGEWETSMASELEKAQGRPISKLFTFQESNAEA